MQHRDRMHTVPLMSFSLQRTSNKPGSEPSVLATMADS
jgi:hypothetical protein